MKTVLYLALMIALCLSLAAAPEAPRHYVCQPCGMECDKPVYDKPGTCPVCGSKLVEQKAAEAMRKEQQASVKVGILIFNGVEIIDYTGPWEVFGGAGFDVYTVAGTKAPVTTAMGMTVVPKYTLADAPQPDILLVPGGDIHEPLASAATLKWVADRTARTVHTLSVCNGAFILAHAGLLDGLSATTTYHLLGKLQKEFPKTKVLRDQRFVDNGRIITSGGLSSGIDGALHVVSKVRGQGFAQEVALGIEYDWRPGAGFARGALAEALIPDLDLDSLGRWTIVSTEGGTDRWEIVASAATDLGGRELLEKLGEALATQGKWINVPVPATGAPSGASSTSLWRFSDSGGRPWKGTLSVEDGAAGKGGYTARLNIARAG
ncbi:MAG TPA: DJ-1/PfpI family protein [Patescibacteria group bacterium]|nr:DJ-1/PfpI family protein [Patescibacteria group bacterium]